MKEGNPEMLREEAENEKKQELIKMKSAPVQDSGLLSRRLKRNLTITA